MIDIESFVNLQRVDNSPLAFSVSNSPVACAAAATAAEAAVVAGKGFGAAAIVTAGIAGFIGGALATHYHIGHYTSAPVTLPAGGVPGTDLSSAALTTLAASLHD
ncbi:hypothetical protein BCF44_13142 [Kutzneria buriramensis]|uniref:Uncharacterized protein n=2 Tax=Kutzneria buriramensis TaxID=1045776 RepID=A0A3E0GVL9_9PSEU|nr:hypothetical protein BCF44_13142 [Kutzneria buriramensis]